MNKNAKNFMEKILNSVHNKNIIEHIIEINRLVKIKRDYFRYCSKLYNAIYDDIRSKNSYLIDKNNKILVCHRGTGVSIFLSDVCVFSKEKTISFKIECEFFEDENTDLYSCKTFKKTYWISVPSKLETNFTQSGFKKWASEIKKENNKIKQKEKKLVLLNILKKYPELKKYVK